MTHIRFPILTILALAAVLVPASGCRDANTIAAPLASAPTPTPTPIPVVGTLRLSGIVHRYDGSSDNSGPGIAGALVEIVSGPQFRQHTQTDAGGRYELSGLSPGTIRVTAANGNRGQTQSISFVRDTTLDFVIDDD